MDIDWSLKKTVADREAEALAERVHLAKLECRRRITAVADETAQMNIMAAQGGGLLTEAQQATWLLALQWVTDMRATWQGLAEAGADVSDDANWPPVPAGVAELGAAY